MMEGNSRGAFKASRELDDAVPLDMVRQMPMAEGVSPSRYFTEARFGKWDAILKEPAPPADLTYTTAVWHYVRGLAFAAKNRPGDAQKEQDKLDEIIAATPPGRMAGFNSANRLLAMAAATLAGEIASANGNHDEADQASAGRRRYPGRAQLRRAAAIGTIPCARRWEWNCWRTARPRRRRRSFAKT